MSALLARFKNIASTSTTLARSATPSSATTQPPSASPARPTSLAAAAKRHLYTNAVMSVSVVLGTVGVVVPSVVYWRGGEREHERTGRLGAWKERWAQHGEEERRQRILSTVGDSRDDRLTALREQLQTSGKYTSPQ